MNQIPANLYALTEWFKRAEGDEALLVTVLANTAGLKGWLLREHHDVLCQGMLSDVLKSDQAKAFDLAATWLLSQMPAYAGPETTEEWERWLENWCEIHKQSGPEEQLERLPGHFNLTQAETVMSELLAKKTQDSISVIQQ